MEWEIGSLVLVIGTKDLGGELDLSATSSRLFASPYRYRIFARNCIDERFFVSLATSGPRKPLEQFTDIYRTSDRGLLYPTFSNHPAEASSAHLPIA
jgi:hypothetical protein